MIVLGDTFRAVIADREIHFYKDGTNSWVVYMIRGARPEEDERPAPESFRRVLDDLHGSLREGKYLLRREDGV